jgi:hypothetical protein
VQPLVFFDQPCIYIDSYDDVIRIVKKMTSVKEFIVIGESGMKIPTEVTRLGKERNVKVVRIRSSGSWNSLYRLMHEVEMSKQKGGYSEASDLMFLTFHSAHAMSAAMKRHRAYARLTSRELYYLSVIDNMDISLDVIDHTLAMMPNVATSVNYIDLSVEQRFKLSAFEFCRYTRPVHCAAAAAGRGLPGLAARALRRPAQPALPAPAHPRHPRRL